MTLQRIIMSCVAAAMIAGTMAVHAAGVSDLQVQEDQTPVVTAHPDIVILNSPTGSGGFSAAATGFPEPTVQWQWAMDRNGPWTDLAFATNPSFVFIASDRDTDALAHGHAVRAVFTNRAGSAITRTARIVSRATWMHDLGTDISSIPLTELTIPGAHDMGTYGITQDSQSSTDGQALLITTTELLAVCAYDPLSCPELALLSTLVRSINESYAQAQTSGKDATHELNDGMRYFDLRVCGHDDGSDNVLRFSAHLVTCHGLEAAPLQEILEQTRAWIDAHPGEIVILDFNHHFQLDIETEADQIATAFTLPGGGTRLVPPPYCTPGDPTSGICAHGLTLRRIADQYPEGRVIVNFENDDATANDKQPHIVDAFYLNHPFLWAFTKGVTSGDSPACTNGPAFPSCFGNSTDVDDVKASVMDTLTRRAAVVAPVGGSQHFERGLVQFLQTTPDQLYVLDPRHWFGSLLGMAKESNPVIGAAVFGCDVNHTDCFGQVRPENLNILAINFYEITSYGSVTFDFVREVITLNAYARTPPIVNLSTAFTPASTGWYNAVSLGGVGKALPVDVFAEDYRYPTGISTLDCPDVNSTAHLSSATSASSVSKQLTLHDGAHLLNCFAADGATLGFHGYGNTGVGPSSTPETRPVVYHVDSTPPTVQCPSDPVFLLNQPLAAVEGLVSDATSGPAQTSASSIVTTNAVGTYSTELTGADAAGNTTTVTCAYKVTYRIALRYDTAKAWKPGSVVPIRIELQDYFGGDVSDKGIVVTARSVTNTVTHATFTPTAPGGTNPNFVFYVSPAIGYEYDLKTTGYGSGSYTLDFVATSDPVLHGAPFLIR
jgi:hypothetical protein